MTDVAIERESVEVLGHSWTWSEDASSRFPVELTGMPHGQVTASMASYYLAVAVDERHRVAAFMTAGHIGLAAAYGIVARNVTLARPAEVIEHEADSLGGYRLPGGDALPLAARTAVLLAGQLAVDVYLTRTWQRDPRRVLVTWMEASGSLRAIPRQPSSEPTAYLFGADAQSPEEWPGRAVHIDHLRAGVHAWLEENWKSIEAIALHLLAHQNTDEDTLAALVGPASSTPIEPLAHEHPLYQSTAIDPRAIDAAAGWWTERLRDRLSEPSALDEADESAAAASGPRWQDEHVGEQTFAAFRTTLADLILRAVENRTPTYRRGLREPGEADEHYTLAMRPHTFDPPDILARAVEAIGMHRDVFYGFHGGGVRLTPRGARLATTESEAPLWPAP